MVISISRWEQCQILTEVSLTDRDYTNKILFNRLCRQIHGAGTAFLHSFLIKMLVYFFYLLYYIPYTKGRGRYGR